MIDLRSDTVTKPSKDMKIAMMEAELGDDVFEDDPTVKALEKKSAHIFGKEAALFTCSGTQSNLIACLAHAKPGERILLDSLSHIFLYEAAGSSRFGGTQHVPIKTDNGIISLEHLSSNLHQKNIHIAEDKLVCIENTHNHAGGLFYSEKQVKELFQFTIERNLKLHIDGARIFNAIVESNTNAKLYGTQCDSLTFCLSKGLGCPVGSVLVGSEEFILGARKIRKALGGGLRQAGILAAAGLYALENNINRLKEDHIFINEVSRILTRKNIKHITPQTNILIWQPEMPINETIKKLKDENILALPFGNNQIRFVAHLGITPSEKAQVLDYLEKSLI